MALDIDGASDFSLAEVAGSSGGLIAAQSTSSEERLWLISKSGSETLPAGFQMAGLSADGRYSVLVSEFQLYLADRELGSMTLVSHAASTPSTPGNSRSYFNSISADGRFVGFDSRATDLIAGGLDENSQDDAFLWDRTTGIVTLVSHTASSATITSSSASRGQALSSDGRFLIFNSAATDLVVGVTDSNGTVDAFVWDRLSGAVSLVSHESADPGSTGNGYSTPTSISADGRYVAVSSEATNLVAGEFDTNNQGDVYLWDRDTGITTLVSNSFGSGSTTGNGHSVPRDMSSDGRYLALYSNSTDLISGFSGSGFQALVWDRNSGVTRLASHVAGSSIAAGNNFADPRAISGDGRYLTFYSPATDLVSGGSDSNGEADAFLWDRDTDLVVLVSHATSSSTTGGDGAASPAAISADGRFVTFNSDATDLVVGGIDTNATSDAFVWDRDTGTIVLVSHASSAPTVAGGSYSYAVAISDDGRYVAFASGAADLVVAASDLNENIDAFLWDRTSSETILLSRAPVDWTRGANSNSWPFAVSPDGRYVAFLSEANDLIAGTSGANSTGDAFHWDRASGVVTLISHVPGSSVTEANSYSSPSAISADGRYVAFHSYATNLVDGGIDSNSTGDAFLWDLSTASVVLVSHAAGSETLAGNGDSYPTAMSGDGRYVLLRSKASNLVAGGFDTNGDDDVFLWDRESEAMTLVSHTPGAATTAANGPSDALALSFDGRYVAFSSYASNLIAGGNDTNSARDAFLWDRDTGLVVLVSHTLGSDLSSAGGVSAAAAISFDGRFVAFTSSAADLVAGFSGSGEQAYLWDRTTTSVVLVSHAAASATTAGNAPGFSCSMSSDGRYLAFASQASDLIVGGVDTNNAHDVFLWDRDLGSVTLVSHAPGTATTAADGYSFPRSISADGAKVALSSWATGLIDGQADANGSEDVFVWDRMTGANILVSHAMGAPTTTADLGSSPWAISGDGRYVALHSGANDLTSGSFDGYGQALLWRAPIFDTTPPTDPTIDSANPSVGAWSNDNSVDVTWSGALDEVDGSGLAGYSIEWNTTPLSTPDTVVDVVHGVDPHSSVSLALADGADHYFHLSTCDIAGNCTGTVHVGAFWIDATAPGAPGTVASSSHDPTGTPVSDSTIDVAWGAATDGTSGVASYSFAFDGTPTGSCVGGSTVTVSATSAALGEGSWYVHVCAVDLAGNTGAPVHGGPWTVDTTSPVGLAVNSSSHTVATWSNDITVDFGFSGATDGSGVAGYAVVYDQATGTGPACAATQAASTFTGNSSPDADNWWIHVRAIDSAGNCGATVHLGPFRVDTQDPASPTGLGSSSHDVGVASNDDTVDVEWSAALDQAGLSGIDGYGFFFSIDEDDDCDGVLTADEDVLAATSAALADGEYHFHLCAVDNAGNWSPVVSIGPFVIDTAGAAVVAIRTVADTGDGELSEEESTPVGVTQLIVEFDGAMFDASGDTDPADVTNPSNYHLYQAGTDGAVQSVACGTPVGDDVEVAFAAASYSASTTTTALSLSSSLALPQEIYRLLVCPTIEDDAGTAIAGFTRNFTVQTTDRLGNPNFDHDLAGWVVTEPVPGSLLWSSSDLSSAPTSGSAEIVTASGASAVWTLSQCFAVSTNPVEMSGWTEIESSVGGAPLVGARIDYFDGAGCSGAVVGSTLSPPVAGDTAGLRTYLRLTRSSPPAAALAVLVSMEVEGGGAAIFTARLDDLFYGSTPSLFADGFESNGTGAWSVALP